MSDPPSRGSRLRGVMGGLALVFGGLLAGAILTEITLRVFDLGPGASVAFATQPVFERIPGVHHPNQDLIDRSLPALPFRVRINNLGYRGPDAAIEKPAGQTRILLVGDSFGFGAQIGEDSTLSTQLEGIMRQRCGDVIVLNASIPGTTITEHRPMFMRGLALKPDMALLEVTGNDIEDMMMTPSRWEQMAADRRSRDIGPLATVQPVLRRLRLWRVARAGLSGVNARRSALTTSESRGARAESTVARLRAEYMQELRGLIVSLDSAGIPLTIALYPRMTRLRQPGSSAVAFLKTQLVNDSGVDVVDLRDGLLASTLPDSALYLIPHDVHPTGRSYGIAAAQLAGQLPCRAPAGRDGSTR